MKIELNKDLQRLHDQGLLKSLLCDQNTGNNILWATDSHEHLGAEFSFDNEILEKQITGGAVHICTRSLKSLLQQNSRKKSASEVFTPLWLCRDINNQVDERWFGRPDVFFHDGMPTEKIEFPAGKTWQEYVKSPRLEITCGEAPFLVGRYDMVDGDVVPVAERVGILDRKLRVVTENTKSEDSWYAWALRSVQATYGYELQGDNVLIARVNILMTVVEQMEHQWGRRPTAVEYRDLIQVISWNIWQMDGLTGTVPTAKGAGESPACQIIDWRSNSCSPFLRK